MQVQIKFNKFGSNSAFGGFEPGNLMRVNAELAKHLVEQAKVAVYVTTPAVEQPVEPKPARKGK